MDKHYNHLKYEKKLYQLWHQSGSFLPVGKNSTKPFCIILPPPNANDPLHAGHALFCIEDILVRFHRMLGEPTLFLPGTDHAGIETQFVFEKKLAAKNKSRFDYDRNTLYKLISKYVEENRGIAVEQMKSLGLSLDWSRERFTLDPEHVSRVYAVFKNMHNDNLIYRDEKIVNFCTHCGTSFSNLEIKHKEVMGKLWYIKYPLQISNNNVLKTKLKNNQLASQKFIIVATTRPETMLGDTAVAVNPKDSRYQNLIGKSIDLPLVNRTIPIVSDQSVDPDFGTGAVKVTPCHSPEDFEIAKRHNLQFIRILDYNGRFNSKVPAKFQGKDVRQVRALVLSELKKQDLLQKEENYQHSVAHCYKCGQPIEPITMAQWFVKMKSLGQKAARVVKNNKIIIFPPRFKKEYLQWLDKLHDWNISRQIIWGPRIPAWYVLDENPNIVINFIDKNGHSHQGYWKDLKSRFGYKEIKSGLQSLVAPADASYYLSRAEALKKSHQILQETDTFDTWFSSAQWPYSTLGWQPDGNHSQDYYRFYPTQVLDTSWDILFFWVARMVMVGLYATGKIPFEVVHIHSRVVDKMGKKMSKSKGNVVNPINIISQYGADSLRFALVVGVAPGSNIALSDDKLRAARNFVNKIWNAARFVCLSATKTKNFSPDFVPDISRYEKNTARTQPDQKILKSLQKIIKSTTRNINQYRFGTAAEDLYHFFWHDFCDQYIESAKQTLNNQILTSSPESKKRIFAYYYKLSILIEVLTASLKLLHPFIPFSTEAIYQELKKIIDPRGQSACFAPRLLITADWPKSNY